MNNEVLVIVKNVSKKFCRDLKRSLWYGLEDIAGEIRGRNNHNKDLRPKEFWAVNNISFELKRGEVLGLIGRNGAGKTTLLKVLNNLIKPDAGSVTLRGRVGALIALGAGFNPILTGRENIYINGAVLGLTKKKIDAKFDEIVDFAELWDFIDTPVQSYSSGMQVRLGFAVTTALKPDVLLLDEILAVGDAAFRSKCYREIGKLAKDAAVIFVSHNMNDIVRICDRCLLLDKGRTVHSDNLEVCVSRYLETNDGESDDCFEKINTPVKSAEFEWSNLDIKYGDTIELVAKIETFHSVPNVRFQIPFYDNQSMVVAEWASKRTANRIDLKEGHNIIKVLLGPIHLKRGVYKMSIVMADSGGIGFPIWSYKNHTINVDGPLAGAYPYQLKAHVSEVQG